MNEFEHNIQKEEKFLELMGYQAIGPDSNNRWIIIDKNQTQVGYIQFRKLHNGNSKKGTCKIFGYHIMINSPKVEMEYDRAINDKNGEEIPQDSAYSFDIKKKGEKTAHVEMTIGKYPSLTIWSDKYGFMDFNGNQKGIYLNFRSKTKKYNIQETVVFHNLEDERGTAKEYVYQIQNCKKEKDIDATNKEGITTREIWGKQSFPYGNLIYIKERKWKNRKLIKERNNQVEGTIEQMAIQQEMGIDSLNRFRERIKKLLPFKEDIISVLIPEETIKEGNLQAFFQEQKGKKKKKESGK